MITKCFSYFITKYFSYFITKCFSYFITKCFSYFITKCFSYFITKYFSYFITKCVPKFLTFKKIFAKLKFSTALFEKIPSFVCLVFKIENKWILNCKICFLKKQAGLKINCTRLSRFVLMITDNMLTQEYYFS